ncbi:MAG: hypothetical protein ISR64_10205 [Deltaproteobacteria bacterium]|nr:hypothetical protein [Deltaproteobacteria bacterium]
MKKITMTLTVLTVLVGLLPTVALAAEDALIDATFFDKDGNAIPDFITNNTADFPTATNTVSFCTDVLPISVNIHAQRVTGGAGAENGSVTLIIGAAGTGSGGTYNGTLDMAGNYTIPSINIPDISSTAATHSVTVTLNADATYNQSTAPGFLDICASATGGQGQGLIYSDVANIEAAWMWNLQDPRTAIGHLDLDITTADNINAISLGDDTLIFGKIGGAYRYDYFAVDQTSTGASGDVQTRSAGGIDIQRDLYAETAAGSNTLCLDDLITQSGGGTTSGDVIDAFDFGDHGLLPGDWVYFSLETGSSTLASSGWSAGDVLAAQYMMPGTLVRFAAAGDIGNPGDIDALSVHDHGLDGSYDGPSQDYIIYSSVSGSDIHHYGYGATGGGGPVHDHAGFGLLPADEVVALEHKTIPCCNLSTEETSPPTDEETSPPTDEETSPPTDIVSGPEDSAGSGKPDSKDEGSPGCSAAGTVGSGSGGWGPVLLVLLCLLWLSRRPRLTLL